tara:strand:+ start:9 stop:833 length:825 start_codon:yes stop_codon:yes gene_type:complete
MTAYIQSILFDPIKTNKDSIDDIRELMLTTNFKKNKQRITGGVNAFDVLINNTRAEVVEQEAPIQHNSQPLQAQIRPTQKDTLFWCLYIAKHGYDEYKEIQQNYGGKQLDIQRKIGEHLRSNLHLVKNVNMRITKASAQEILSDLLTDTKKTEMNVLYGYCIYYELNLILLDPSGENYLEIISNTFADSHPVFVVQKNTHNNYSLIETPLTNEEYAQLVDTKIKLDSHLRPLKAIGNFKVDELRILADKVGIDIYEKKWSKTDLYQEITTKIAW